MITGLRLIPRVPLWLQVIRLDHSHRDDRELARHAKPSHDLVRATRLRALKMTRGKSAALQLGRVP